MNKRQRRRFNRAVDIGFMILVARKGGVTWTRIKNELGIGRRTAKDALDVYRYSIVQNKPKNTIPKARNFDWESGELPDITLPGTLSTLNRQNFYVCLSEREFYYERQGEEDTTLTEAFDWYKQMVTAASNGEIHNLRSTTYYSD
ncbi:hypothetical protein [Salinibacter phage M8CC-19]|uniref:Uncharacterized protein n=2 Tax=Kryptosalinivirus M8CC19 TaxID=2560720 RepID=A0A2I6UG73_9CAUD|nr:hypothetical protein FGG63_gp35 [Salinibacter phage M8CC-19]AUO78982.1 hypothetical protein [Salinibacter phage M8CC-19]AUO79216.1 hypothetical protein [Salinibacter phage M31CC-1]